VNPAGTGKSLAEFRFLIFQFEHVHLQGYRRQFGARAELAPTSSD